MLALLSVFATELSNTQAKSKRDVESRVHERAVLTAALVSSLFSTVGTQGSQDEQLYGQRRIKVQTLNERKAQNLYIAVLSPAGRVLAASQGFNPQGRADLPQSAAFALVRAGHPYGIGNILPYDHTGVVNIAVTFHTHYGNRVLLTGLSPLALAGFLTGELKQIPGVKGARNYILDGNRAIIASTYAPRPVGTRLDSPAQISALSHLSGDRNGRYYDQVPLANSTWRVLLSAPNGPLYASVSGLRGGIPWLIFAAFAFVALIALALGWRVIRSADRAMREAHHTSQMKSNFIANISHEIRTPLNGVVGMLALLSESRLSAEQREYVEVAKSSSDALMTVINDILDMGRIEAGRLKIELDDFDLQEAVEGSCEMLSALATSKGLVLQAYVRNDVPRCVRGDRMRIRQVLVNLIANSVKFTPEGEVGVEVTLEAQTEHGPRIRFEVRDTGIGIEPHEIDRMFEAFSQAEASTTRRFGGTGLGLAISRELTQLMGGTIGAWSEPGHGSTFWFEVPFESADLELGPPVPVDDLRDLRVLVADGNSSNRRVFEAYIESWGMRSATAADANDVLERLKRAEKSDDPFDVVLLDHGLPGASGVELAQQIMAVPELRGVRVILMISSGQVAPEDPSGSVKRRIAKPLRQSRLLDAISAVMSSPVPLPEPTDGARPVEEPTVEEPSGLKILVAEDQSVNWKLVDRLLEKRGHEAVNAADGSSALRKLESDHYDLVLMDCQMPVLDGYETTRELRRREAAEQRSRVPVVAMTASAMEGDRERCIAAGMDDYLAKPITSERLDELLDRWLPERVTGGAAARKR